MCILMGTPSYADPCDCCISGISIKPLAIIAPEVKIAADHPFMFFIVDDINTLPLFSGWVVAP